jgi:8-oxo-dGTP pyrophosphatase MutT (NUDIX family)
MSRANLSAQLSALQLSDPESVEIRDKMLALIKGTATCFERTAFPAHFTGSALVVSADGSRVLLHLHRKLNKWLQFGGHCDGDEDILRVARREAQEESGIWGLVVASARPFDLDIHEIPSHGPEPKHFHYDVRFMLIAPEDAVSILSEESTELRWFTRAELDAIEIDASLQRMIDKWQAIAIRRQAHASRE